uniref:Chorismate lyase n=1 Tax=Apophlaea sinclairii TaxID=212746 RepID=A0A1C9CBL3_9FLOR|nr:hypothetical protein Apop_059 [Apophlaea sinclairii]AOM65749.1 hypothetical protein Apop_059 [Apophlaea sinclairii]
MNKYKGRYCLLWSNNNLRLNIRKVYRYLPTQSSLLLLSDGSFTKVLDSIVSQVTNTQIVNQRDTQSLYYNQEVIVNNINLKYRNKWLISKTGQKLLFATSLYKSIILEDLQLEIVTPIGKVLINSELNLYRNLYRISCFCSKWFEQKFGLQGYVWSRRYTLYHKHLPIIFVQEFFSPNLNKYSI